MYSRYHRVFNSDKINKSKLLYHRTAKSLFNNTSFKYSANVSNKDCVRLAFAYGMCGTFASYLDMHYDGKILVFKWSVPTPERFVFCTWCWAVGGMASWMLFWTKTDSLIRAASSRIRYGLLNGAQTTSIALALSFSTIGFWSVYFDISEFKNDNKAWQNSMNQTELMTDITSSRTTTNTLIQEEGNEDDDHNESMDAGVKIINDEINKTEEKKDKKSKPSKPVLRFDHILSNMYEPCKVFFMCNAPIWIVCGSFTGMIAARLLTSGVLLNPTTISTASAMSFLSIQRDNDTDNLPHLMDDDDDIE